MQGSGSTVQGLGLRFKRRRKPSVTAAQGSCVFVRALWGFRALGAFFWGCRRFWVLGLVNLGGVGCSDLGFESFRGL